MWANKCNHCTYLWIAETEPTDCPNCESTDIQTIEE